jgi:hypothetical protein
MRLGNPTAGVPAANIALNCNGRAGKVTVPFSFVANNQPLVCVLLDTPPNFVRHICAGSVAAATTCANTIIQNGGAQGGTVSVPTYSFSPN